MSGSITWPFVRYYSWRPITGAMCLISPSLSTALVVVDVVDDVVDVVDVDVVDVDVVDDVVDVIDVDVVDDVVDVVVVDVVDVDVVDDVVDVVDDVVDVVDVDVVDDDVAVVVGNKCLMAAIFISFVIRKMSQRIELKFFLHYLILPSFLAPKSVTRRN